MSSNVEPFIKYAGGKTQLMHNIVQRVKSIPVALKQYVEPFIGSGSVLMGLIAAGVITAETRVIIGDLNSAIINLFTVVRDNPLELLTGLDELLTSFNKDKASVYAASRDKFNSQCSALERAILFMFLNTTCFNGLYRTNGSGEFNVPIGKSSSGGDILLSDNKKKNIIGFSQILRTYNITMYCGDYSQCTQYMDNLVTLLYMDPPYVPVKSTSFTSYMGDFNHDKYFAFVHEMGRAHRVLASNSDATLAIAKSLPMKITRCVVRRLIGSKSRDKCVEILTDNFDNWTPADPGDTIDIGNIDELLEQLFM